MNPIQTHTCCYTKDDSGKYLSVNDGFIAWAQLPKAIATLGISVLMTETSLVSLTPQQTACLKYLAHGFTHKQIGLELGLSSKTVEHYLEAVKLKLNCQSRADLILQAIERGLVSIF